MITLELLKSVGACKSSILRLINSGLVGFELTPRIEVYDFNFYMDISWLLERIPHNVKELGYNKMKTVYSDNLISEYTDEMVINYAFIDGKKQSTTFSNNEPSIYYEYDGDKLIKVTQGISITTYTYDGDNLIMIKSGTTQINNEYDSENRIIKKVFRMYKKDLLEDITLYTYDGNNHTKSYDTGYRKVTKYFENNVLVKSESVYLDSTSTTLYTYDDIGNCIYEVVDGVIKNNIKQTYKTNG